MRNMPPFMLGAIRFAGGLMAALLLSAFVGIGALAPASGAAPLPGSSTPLPGSSFQGGDGNQDDQAPNVDWQGLQAAGRVVHSPDPNAADSAFAGGSKEDAPGKWDLTTERGGVNPAKANILDAFAAVDQPGADTFLYLAFTRAKTNGDTFVAFELNRDARMWNNGRAEIPCRRTGDLLVVLAAHGKGIEVELERWTTTATDPATDCATRGQLEPVASVPAGDAQGAVNAGPITSRLPGFYPPSSTISEAGAFGEAALNLSALMTAAFHQQCFAFGSIWMHSRSSLSASSNMQDYVAPQPLAVRTCAASGVKFFDLNANGQRDAGEPGIPRFLIWADYNNNGRRDPDEPFTVTDELGRYVLEDIRPPHGSYTLRETLLSARSGTATSWLCSYPNAGTTGGFGDGPGGLFGCGWGPIASASTPYAQDRDFGNWLPARLTLEKQLWPSSDPGRFDLKVNGQTILPAAGDGASTTIAVPPGFYDITEAAVPPANASDYRSEVICRATTQQRGLLRSGTTYAGLVLRPADQATCRFVNVRPAAPAIAIEKTGPTVATAGDTLHYTLAVTNPGEVPLAAATVHVSDDLCDHAPVLEGKTDTSGEDRTPDTLDPGDTWTYECSHTTPAASADCSATALTNTATADATAGSVTVSDNGSLTTTLNCPTEPPEPPLPPTLPPGPLPPTPPLNPLPSPTAPVTPAGPEPPPAGEAGVAGITARAGCLTRASQLQLTGTLISRISVAVDGRQARQMALKVLQSRAAPVPQPLASGRHRVSIRVAFQAGSGTPPVTLAQTITICAHKARLPRFVGLG